MQSAKVLGKTHATTKHKSLNGCCLIVAQPLLKNGNADGPPMIVIDPFGSRPGDTVMITSDSKLMQEIVKDTTSPARWSVLGLLDVTQ